MRRLAVPCALIAALGGCGDDDDAPATAAVSVKANSTLRVTATEYAFDPSRVVVRGAGRLTIRLRNAGSLAHNLKLLEGEEEVGGTPTFGGGETRSRSEERRVGKEC